MEYKQRSIYDITIVPNEMLIQIMNDIREMKEKINTLTKEQTELLTTAQACKVLNISRNSLFNLINKGVISFSKNNKDYRFDKTTLLNEFLSNTKPQF